MGLMGSKPLASLSSGLLARKGQAKPAMRPQVFHPAASIEDLGWNDMGHVPAAAAEAASVPPVLVERDTLFARIAPPTPAPAAVAPALVERIGRESARQTAKGKAAFTLRLDAASHLRLRLASAVANRSAQAIVAEALDRMIATMPEVETLATQLPVKESHR